MAEKKPDRSVEWGLLAALIAVVIFAAVSWVRDEDRLRMPPPLAEQTR